MIKPQTYKPIRHKAKRADTKEWVEGYVFPGRISEGKPVYYIVDSDTLEDHEIIESTICLGSSLRDYHGKEIFTGDFTLRNGHYRIVIFYGGAFRLVPLKDWPERKGEDLMDSFRQFHNHNAWNLDIFISSVDVIGNIFDGTPNMVVAALINEPGDVIKKTEKIGIVGRGPLVSMLAKNKDDISALMHGDKMFSGGPLVDPLSRFPKMSEIIMDLPVAEYNDAVPKAVHHNGKKNKPNRKKIAKQRKQRNQNRKK